VCRSVAEGLVAKLELCPVRRAAKTLAQSEVRREGRFVVGGVIQQDDLNALMVGRRELGRLRFLGIVEFGVGRRLVAALLEFHSYRNVGEYLS
jgi:hypothetical protein